MIRSPPRPRGPDRLEQVGAVKRPRASRPSGLRFAVARGRQRPEHSCLLAARDQLI
jgi:hypothetical protein